MLANPATSRACGLRTGRGPAAAARCGAGRVPCRGVTPRHICRAQAEATAPSVALSESLLKAFYTEGFVHIPDVLSEEEMSGLIDPAYYAFLRGEIQVDEKDVCDLGSSGNRKYVQPSLLSITSARNYHPGWQNSVLEKRCESLATQLLDTDEVELDFDQIQAKRPSCKDSVMPWVQERAYLPDGLPEECESSVSFWLAVTDVPVEAGCLRFLPGSHLKSLRRHTPVRPQTQEEKDAAAADDIPRALRALVAGGERAALVPIKRGDVVAVADRVVHGSGPNNSPQWRCSYVVNFKRVGCIVSERSLGIENPYSQPATEREGADKPL